MIKFKAGGTLEHDFYNKLEPKLRGFLLMVAGFIEYHFNKDMIITSLFREDGGVHNFWRGADQRTHDPETKLPLFEPEEIDAIVKFALREVPYNYNGRYDLKFSIRDERKEPLKQGSKTKWSGPHLHYQTDRA